MKIVLFFPPQWNPAAPYLSVPLLAGQLKSKGYDVVSHDLNVEFYNDNLNKTTLLQSLQLANNFLVEHKKEYEKLKLHQDNLSFEEDLLLQKYEEISNYLNQYDSRTKKIINLVEDAVNVMKSEKYYVPDLLYKAKIIIEHALDIVLLPYYPYKMDTNHYYNNIFKLNFEDICYQCKSSSVNIFYDYFRKKLKNKYNNEKIFGISIVSESQVIASLTLARYLKERNKNCKIILGGSLVTRIESTFFKRDMLFNEYCDYVIQNDGEKAIIELAEYLENKRDIKNVSNLIYKNDEGKIIKNEILPINVKEISLPSLEGINLKDYFSPDIVMLLQMSKGCYWGKCAFCSFSYKKSYHHRDISEIIKEIKYYKSNFGIRYFRFSDDAIPPSFFRELAQAFIDNKLDIKYVAFARMEKEFSYELLKLIADSGCVIIQWGLETASERLLKLLNKGTDKTDKNKLLADSDKAGIANYVFLMYAFPTETVEEAIETHDFVKQNWPHIMNFILSKFCLEKKSILKDNYMDYGVEEITDDEDFLAHCNMECKQMNYSEARKIRKLYNNSFIKMDNGKMRFLSILLTDYTFLYITKYGKDYIKNYTI